MLTKVQGFRLGDKLSSVITAHQTVMAAALGRAVNRTEALEDILSKFRETKQLSPIQKPKGLLEAFLHG